jgi:hypothetical protein
MAASTAPREASKKPGFLQNYALGICRVNKGTLVSLRTDGLLYPARAGTATDIFAGVAYETIDNSTGTAGGAFCRVEKSGSYIFNATSAVTQADVGQPYYAADDQTVTTVGTSNHLVGYAVEPTDSTDVRIRIDRAVQ